MIAILNGWMYSPTMIHFEYLALFVFIWIFQIVDLSSHSLFKTLRGVHQNVRLAIVILGVFFRVFLDVGGVPTRDGK